MDFSGRWCVNAVQCDMNVYASPDVPILALPGNASAIVDSIHGTTPQGDTPTAPALEGAIAHATDWATSHPGDKVVAVLATDGLPTECDPTDITKVAALAAKGLNGAISIPTFVIGVFAPGDTTSPTNLDTIARAGGTARAFVIDTGGDVTKEFQDALTAIRVTSQVSCQFKLPESDAGVPLDLSAVNLELSPQTGKSHLLTYVPNAAACATNPGNGWYYDHDPSDPSLPPPTKILVCDDACQTFQAAVGATVKLVIGCPNRIH